MVQTTPVAIIGMASIFAKAKNLGEYWDNILRKIDCITEVPASRWNAADYYDPDPTAEDKTYCKRGGFIPDIDFDPVEFGLPPNILEVTDVSQLLSLVVAKDALEDAGYGENREFNRDSTGVVLGVVGMSSKLFTPLMARLQYPVWEKVLLNCGLSAEDTRRVIAKMKLAYVGWEESAFPGTIGNVIAGRIANRFDLGGMNCVVDAACAPNRLAFGHGAHGKPYLRSPQSRLEFNLSHSTGRALIAVSRGIPLGVDVEAVRPVDEMETIMANYFSPLERDQLRSLPALQKPEGFFNAWTRKEAYVKGRGDGFHLPLNRFSVSLVQGKPARLLDETEKQPGSDGWRLVNLALAAGAGYCAALTYRSQAACRLIFQSVQAYASNVVDIDRPIQVEY